jgi:CubicO group peptidase (beta-lactamase class C family)
VEGLLNNRMATDFAGLRDKALSFTHLLSHFRLFMLLSRSWFRLLACLLSLPALAQTAPPVTAPLDVAAVDAVVARTLRAFDVPGIAVAVVKDGQVVLAKGYGVSSLKTKAPMDANTLVGIGSNTKAFTTAALGLLVDEGKLRWDDKVTDHLPEFKMYDPYVTAEFTVRDLLCHRSGLGRGEGDLMFFPDSTDFTAQDIIHNLRYFKPVSSFRSKYDYDNNLYIVAGEVVTRISGQPWADFVQARLLQPLGMRRSAAGFLRLPDPANVADAHAVADGQLRVIRRHLGTLDGAAGGIYSSVADMSQWALMLLGGPGAPAPLLKPATQGELWSPQTLKPLAPGPTPYNTHFMAYGLGWNLNDSRGYKLVSHVGGLPGMVTQVQLVPELRLGIIVLTNQESLEALRAVSNTLLDHYLGVTGQDRVQEMLGHKQTAAGQSDQALATVWKQVAAAQKAVPKKPDYAAYVGRYHDAWLGDVRIFAQGPQLWFKAQRAPRLTGQLLPYRGNTYVVRWRDRSLNADAYAAFTLDAQGRASSFQMKPISAATDFSYDFQDLNLQRVVETATTE